MFHKPAQPLSSIFPCGRPIPIGSKLPHLGDVARPPSDRLGLFFFCWSVMGPRNCCIFISIQLQDSLLGFFMGRFGCLSTDILRTCSRFLDFKPIFSFSVFMGAPQLGQLSTLALTSLDSNFSTPSTTKSVPHSSHLINAIVTPLFTPSSLMRFSDKPCKFKLLRYWHHHHMQTSQPIHHHLHHI